MPEPLKMLFYNLLFNVTILYTTDYCNTNAMTLQTLYSNTLKIVSALQSVQGIASGNRRPRDEQRMLLSSTYIHPIGLVR